MKIRNLLTALLAIFFTFLTNMPVYASKPLKYVILPYYCQAHSASDETKWQESFVNQKITPRLIRVLRKEGLDCLEPYVVSSLLADSRLDLSVSFPDSSKRRKFEELLSESCEPIIIEYGNVFVTGSDRKLGVEHEITPKVEITMYISRKALSRDGIKYSKELTVVLNTSRKGFISSKHPGNVLFSDEKAQEARRIIDNEYDEFGEKLAKTVANRILDILATVPSGVEKNIVAVPPPIPATSDSKPAPKPPVANAVVSSKVRDKWALIVGIGEFQDRRIPKLKYAAKDAEDFRNYLVNEANFAPDHVRLLLNEKATERRVVSELGNKFLARVAQPDDLIVLYFSTHGSSSKHDLRGKNFLVAYDTDRDDLYASGIEMQRILDSINDRVLSGRALLVLDACHSGATTIGAKSMGNPGNFDAEELAQGSGKLVICSSKPDEQSWESSRYANGIFTRRFLEGLKIHGNKTKLGEAFAYTSSAVKTEVKEDQALNQEPVLRSLWDGSDLILAVPASSPQPLPASVRKILEADSSRSTVIPVNLKNKKIPLKPGRK